MMSDFEAGLLLGMIYTFFGTYFVGIFLGNLDDD